MHGIVLFIYCNVKRNFVLILKKRHHLNNHKPLTSRKCVILTTPIFTRFKEHLITNKNITLHLTLYFKHYLYSSDFSTNFVHLSIILQLLQRNWKYSSWNNVNFISSYAIVVAIWLTVFTIPQLTLLIFFMCCSILLRNSKYYYGIRSWPYIIFLSPLKV